MCCSYLYTPIFRIGQESIIQTHRSSFRYNSFYFLFFVKKKRKTCEVKTFFFAVC